MSVDDVLERLKAELRDREQRVAAEQSAICDLRLAIKGIEGGRQDQPVAEGRRKGRRGFLKRALLDCLRDGIGDRADIGRRLAEMGVKSSASSISNAIYRAQVAGEIGYDPVREIYTLKNDEGPDANATRPLQTNGAAAVTA